MGLLDKHSGLYTDHYELTMAQAYYLSGRKDEVANFDYFFRKNPFEGGYVVFAGLADLIDILHNFSFDKEDVNYLESIGFNKKFTQYLNNFRFTGDVYSVDEGELVFPNEPVLRIQGKIIETQIIETVVLNILNFESLIATKASRIRQVAGDRTIIDFGLRRAQGLGGISATRASIIGGANSTSNVYGAMMYGLESTGTQAHSYIQSFDHEIQAFRQFSEAFPDKCILLVDTYDTLKSGMPNAIRIAKEMEEKGQKLFGIRLDSGDLAYLSKKARKVLDDHGLRYVKIVASNQLDEYVIKSLLEQDAPIDAFGVGTSMVIGRPDAALDGVYKLTMNDNKPKLKISESIEKIINPGIKKVARLIDENGFFYGDAIVLNDEQEVTRVFHPIEPDQSFDGSRFNKIFIHRKIMEKGKVINQLKTPVEASKYRSEQLKKLPGEHRRFENPHIYKVGLSEKLHNLRAGIIKEIKSRIEHKTQIDESIISR